ncbi:ferrous iron transport protein A [Seleniivibrio sp.]|uniref:ferrous iron transport protein A n=1 Tax=Seleniivibrio sp. TaxID=2898801 RepID=UPI0025CEC7CB|nr:ferrous iron transport protein A [Seleniivibrio sp.]MCD8553446.1 ferrous iron transport protein A [Seleniivibrio sp.]
MKLSDAKSGGFYKVISVKDAELARRLGAYGIFAGTIVSKVGRGDIELATLKISVKEVTKALSGSLARHLFYKSPSGEKRSIYEHETGTDFTVVVPKTAAKDMARLGIKGGDTIQVMRKLPHMEYITLVGHKTRCRLSEAHAACILGDGKQFSFASKSRDFIVDELLSQETYAQVMSVNGIQQGTPLTLEGIETGKSVHLDDYPDMVICTAQGLRVFISESTAEKINAE